MIISDVLVELADFKNKNSQGFQAKRENHLQSQKNKLSDFKKKKKSDFSKDNKQSKATLEQHFPKSQGKKG